MDGTSGTPAVGKHGTGRETASARAKDLSSDWRETADAYAGEVFRKGRYRVAVCRDGIQWLFQRRRPRESPGGAAWDTLGYCVSRKGLMRLHRAHIGPEAPEILTLPEQIERRRPNG
jgi:hypothetical protein